MKIVDVEPIIAMVRAAIVMIDIMKVDSSGRSELEEMLKTLESEPEVTDINAGKTQPSEEGYSKDIISRQAVMRAIDEALVGKGCSADGTMMARLINDYVIKKVPPAEPEKRTEERAETHACDCIERQAAGLTPSAMSHTSHRFS